MVMEVEDGMTTCLYKQVAFHFHDGFKACNIGFPLPHVLKFHQREQL